MFQFEPKSILLSWNANAMDRTENDHIAFRNWIWISKGLSALMAFLYLPQKQNIPTVIYSRGRVSTEMLKRWYQAVSRVVFLRRVIAEARACVPFLPESFFSSCVLSISYACCERGNPLLNLVCRWSALICVICVNRLLIFLTILLVVWRSFCIFMNLTDFSLTVVYRTFAFETFLAETLPEWIWQLILTISKQSVWLIVVN